MEKKKIEDKVKALFGETFSEIDIVDVPDIEDQRLTHGASGLKGEFTFLYADIRGSSSFTDEHRLQTIAKTYKAFHYCAVEAIKSKGGRIRSFDGDRVLGVFAGGQKVNSAVEAAKLIIGCKNDVLIPWIKTMYKNDAFDIGVGVATGTTLVMKAGVGYDKNNRDLVWIGDAPNKGAKLSDQAKSPDGIFICYSSYRRLHDHNKFQVKNGIQVNHWTKTTMDFGSKSIYVYKSRYYSHV